MFYYTVRLNSKLIWIKIKYQRDHVNRVETYTLPHILKQKVVVGGRIFNTREMINFSTCPVEAYTLIQMLIKMVISLALWKHVWGHCGSYGERGEKL